MSLVAYHIIIEEIYWHFLYDMLSNKEGLPRVRVCIRVSFLGVLVNEEAALVWNSRWKNTLQTSTDV